MNESPNNAKKEFALVLKLIKLYHCSSVKIADLLMRSIFKAMGLVTLFSFSASCTLLYHIYPGRPKENDFKYINKKTIVNDTNKCLIKRNGLYECTDHINGDPPYLEFLIFFEDGRFCMDSYVSDTIYYHEYIKELYSDYKMAQFYGYYYCNLDTVRVEFVSEVRDGFRNNYYFKEFIAINDSTLTSKIRVVRNKKRAIKDISTFYLKNIK